MPPVGWTKYKEIPIAGFSGDQTDLNYIVIATYESDMKSDFSDIRFVDSDDETLLDQHRESYTSETTSLWIIQVDVPAAGKTIRMYYGNAGASLKDDEADTFPWYDDFTGDDGDPPNTDKWTISDATYVRILDNNLRIFTAYSNLLQTASGKTGFGAGYALRFRIKKVGYSGTSDKMFGLGEDGSEKYYYRTGTLTRWQYLNAYDSATALDLDSYNIIMIKMIDAELKRFYFDDVLEYSRDTDTEINDQNAHFHVQALAPDDDYRFDWVYYLKLPQDGTEPAALELGEEQLVISKKMSGKDGIVLYGATFTITDATHSAGTVTITSASHTLAAAERILIENVEGMTDLNGSHTVNAISGNTFDVLLTTEQSYTSGGTARRKIEVTGWVINIETVMIEITDSGDEGWKKFMTKFENWYGIFRGLLWVAIKYPTLNTEVALKLLADTDTHWSGQATIDFETERVPVPESKATMLEYGFTGTGILTPS